MATKKSSVRSSSKSRARARVVVAEPKESPSDIVRTAFVENREINKLITEFRSPSVRASLRSAMAAEKKFENFSAASFPKGGGQTYLAPNESLTRTITGVIDRGIEKFRDAAGSQSMKLDLGPDFRDVIKPSAGGTGRDFMGTINAKQFLDKLNLKLTTTSFKNEPIPTECEVQEQVNEWFDAIEGKKEKEEEEKNEKRPREPDPLSVKKLVETEVSRLMTPVTPPETLPVLNLPKRATRADAAANLQTFELRAGASDVTSYHDFNTIQIAFEHVWTELFDRSLKGLGTALYQTYIDHRASNDLPPDQRDPITSIEDLKKLLEDIRKLSDLPPPPPTSGFSGGGFFPSKRGLFGSGMGFVGALPPKKDDPSDPRQNELAIPTATRLSALLAEIDKLLAADYAFVVFAPDSYNFGIMITYRQTWTPENYQVGDLVKTIPLAPKEIRRYTTKIVSKKTRAVKELEENLRTTKTETSSTSRVEREIVSKAEEKTNFALGAKETFGGEKQGYQIDATQNVGGDQSKSSSDTKKAFHEAVLKSAQEYRQQNRVEIDTSTSEESETTTYNEIQNPNDELAVTYLFYELQRTYRIQEKIYQLQPIILVANEVPAPDKIDDAWLITYDWILRRVILDDSFKPALEYLTKSFVGAELNIQLLDNNAKAQKQVVDQIKADIVRQDAALTNDEQNLAAAVKREAQRQDAGAVANNIKRIFDPLGITGKADNGSAAGQTMVDYLQESFDRTEREKARMLERLGVATTALQAAVDKLSAAIRDHYDRIAEIDRLRIHIKQNILYYMQAIWNHEPPDQRFFRLFNKPVTLIEPGPNATFKVTKSATGGPTFGKIFGQTPDNEITVNVSQIKKTTKTLAEVADLDRVLGYKGNYAIYPLKENTFITTNMMQSYIDVSGVAKLRDPDDFANYSIEELKRWATCLYRREKDNYNKKYKAQLEKLIMDRLKSGRPEDDRVIVPTTSLYVEALVGTHTLLEDFKLAHRAMDVKKVQAEVRHAELENVRLAARAMKSKLEDPDIEKKIVVQGVKGGIAIQPDNS